MSIQKIPLNRFNIIVFILILIKLTNQQNLLRIDKPQLNNIHNNTYIHLNLNNNTLNNKSVTNSNGYDNNISINISEINNLNKSNSNSIKTNNTKPLLSNDKILIPNNDIIAQFKISIQSTTTTNPFISKDSSKNFNSSWTRNENHDIYFTHLAYDTKRDIIYAGATNKIYQLSESLKEISHAATGPILDSPQCHAGGCPDDIETKLTQNYNKILIYNPHLDQLIACGSVRQGACEIYNAIKFPQSPKFIDITLAANDELSSTYAYIGPSQYQPWKRDDILYVGTTFTNVGDYRHDVPAISSRKLEDLKYAEFSIQQSIINVDVKYRDHFLVDYVYGFNSSEYAYFAMVQKRSHLAEEGGYVTRLARICITDPNYDSYTEITIQCQAQSGKDLINYNILKDAKITKAGQKLSEQFGIKRDDNVLVTIFSPSKELITNQSDNKSAMCIYSLKEIEQIFNENIHMCFNNTIKDRNLGYISGTINDGRCPIVGSIGNIFNFCTVGLKISGVAPIQARALIHYENESVTSVTATTTGPHSLVFLGTETGRIKKVLISGSNPGQYDEIIVDPGEKILQDTMMSADHHYLYVVSKKTVTKLRTEHCSAYLTCSSCLESHDPFCGWCSLEKRCTIRSACQKDTNTARWLSIGTGQQCIDFESIIPDKIPITELSPVQLVIRTLPEPLNAKYRCVFGNATPIDAEVSENGLICQMPAVDQRPQIPVNMDHIMVPLSVRSSETNKDFVSRLFAYYDCSRHAFCRQCIESEWACKWCLYDNKCVDQNEQCRNQETVIDRYEHCPHIKQPLNPLLLPVRILKEIRFEIENLPKPKLTHSGFLCTVHIEDAQMLLPARVENHNIIVCEKTQYFYEQHNYEYEAKVDITWNRQHYIDTAPVILYKCDVLGSHREHADCSLCVTRDIKYQCSWCGNQCVYNESCSVDKPANECPRPRIDMIRPLNGPIEGGTLVTIEGSNLGIREEDVRGKISIGGIRCELENYEISVKIECRTGKVSHELTAPIKVSNDAGHTESSVQFQFKDIKLDGLSPTLGPKSGGTQISLIGKYLNIGSMIRVFLDDYECQINVTQAFSSRLTCVTSAARKSEPIQTLILSVDGANRTYTCSNFHQQSSLQNYSFSSAASTYYHSCSIYNYTEDPKIMQIKPLRSFASGGRMITVHGTNLDSIQKPEIEVFLDETGESINKSACQVLNSNQMECPSPSVQQKFYEYKRGLEKQITANRHSQQFFTEYLDLNKRSIDSIPQQRPSVNVRSLYESLASSKIGSNEYANRPVTTTAYKIRETQLTLQIGFHMDNVKSVQDLNKHFQSMRSQITYVDDPKYFGFPNNGIKLYKGESLVIEGDNLNLATDETDVIVTIGKQQCNVTSLAQTQLVCIPPEQQPSGTDEQGLETNTGLPLVIVRVGHSLRFQIGYLKYELLKPYIISHIMWGITIGISIIVILLIIILVVYRRKSTQAEREYKRIQIQMDTLESNVRLECKQAFAELQTDMTDLTADLGSTGIPTLDHINYIMKVFFPGVTDHPVLNSPKLRINGPRTNYDTAMLQFEQLISNKYFVLAFIETLEAQKSFNIRDKVNVASLLMIVLMNKMEYATEILKSLLLRLIDKSVQSKHPKLMLRRTESVVEKMLTNYMAICMYDYLKEYAGSPLFLLFKAIKHQIEKGLVDACTNDARYSLSEEKLLREQIEHSVVTLQIIQDDLDEKLLCKVLDWDTITQVKSKILDALFKNTPFSMRPSVHEVDLEWRHGRGGHLTLQDEDLTTKTINGWKRLNTLAHYGVKESAVMSLIAKQNDLTYNSYNNLDRKSLMPSFNNFYYINNSQSHIIINNIGSGGANDLESGLQQPRHYHLVKPQATAILSVDHHSLNLKSSSITSAVAAAVGVTNSSFTNAIGQQANQMCQLSTERSHKAIPEIFLTRLLATKGTIQKFVDDFFSTILTVNEELPPAVKWLFDLLDEQAHRHNILNYDIVHAWKSNSLPLRFWVNFIKNPDFIFDVNKTITVDACLSVIAQTFMDSCSTTEHRLGKDSPSNKLLFAKDIPQYREMVKNFYHEVQHLPQISDQEMGQAMQQLSVQQNEFDTIAALKELYIYVTKYRDQIIYTLENDVNCKKMHLSHKLENVACTLDSEETSAC